MLPTERLIDTTERLIQKYERLVYLHSVTGLDSHYKKAVELLEIILKAES